MERIGWTVDPVTVANTNKDGSGTVYKVCKIDNPAGQYVDSVTCVPFGTNAATVGVLIGSNGGGIGAPNNNFLLGDQELVATTAGTYVSTDFVRFQIGGWFPFGYEIFAQVYHTQASGRQFIAWADPTYQVY